MAIFVPEIFREALNAQIGVNLKMGLLATDVTDEVDEIKQAGDTVHFPVIARIGDAEELSDNVETNPERISMVDNKATVKEIGKTVRILDKEQIQIKGKAKNRVVEQLGEVIAKKIDFDLADAIDKDVVLKVAAEGADRVTITEIESLMGLFGDQIDSDSFAGFVVNSKVASLLFRMPEFVSATYTFAANGNGIVKNGLIGYYRAIPVYVSNNNTYDTDKSECKTYLIKKKALGYVFQKDITVEEERMPKLRATDLTASSLVATKVLDTKGVAVLRKTIA